MARFFRTGAGHRIHNEAGSQMPGNDDCKRRRPVLERMMIGEGVWTWLADDARAAALIEDKCIRVVKTNVDLVTTLVAHRRRSYSA
jgi:hypothetical protein